MYSKNNKNFIFNKKNYRLIILGLLFISLGFILMNGPNSNTNLEGIYDKNYFNKNIFSFCRIRLSSIFIITGFIIEILSIFSKKK